MHRADALHPGWEFAAHVGYSTPEHRDGDQRQGVSPLHRLSLPVRGLPAAGARSAQRPRSERALQVLEADEARRARRTRRRSRRSAARRRRAVGALGQPRARHPRAPARCLRGAERVPRAAPAPARRVLTSQKTSVRRRRRRGRARRSACGGCARRSRSRGARGARRRAARRRGRGDDGGRWTWPATLGATCDAGHAACRCCASACSRRFAQNRHAARSR